MLSSLLLLAVAAGEPSLPPDLVLDASLGCDAQVTWQSQPDPRVSTFAGLLRYRMPGLAMAANVRCPADPRFSHVGFVQFVVDGETRVSYDAGTVVVRFPKLPVIDAHPDSLPWTFPFSVAAFAPSMRVRMEDTPQGVHPLFRRSAGSRYWASGVTPDLATLERDLQLVVVLAAFEPARDRFIPIKAYEWGVELAIERFIHDDGRHDFRAARSKVREPRELALDRLEALAPRLTFAAPGANEAQDYWWVPPSGSRARAVRIRD